MSENRVLSDLPTRDPVTTEQRGINLPWHQWFDEVQFNLGVRNHQVIPEASALNLDARYVDVSTTSSSYAVTLAAPTVPGVYKVIEMSARGGANNVTLALTNIVGGSASTTCTFNTAGGALVLVSLSDKWLVLKEYNVTLT